MQRVRVPQIGLQDTIVERNTDGGRSNGHREAAGRQEETRRSQRRRPSNYRKGWNWGVQSAEELARHAGHAAWVTPSLCRCNAQAAEADEVCAGLPKRR